MIRTNKLIIAASLVALAPLAAFAGREVAPMPPASSDSTVTFSAEIGTTGYGGQLGWRFHPNYWVRGGIHAFSFDENRTIEGVDYNAKADFTSEPLTLDIFPWAEKSFRISVGALFSQSELTGSASPGAGFNFDLGGQTFRAVDVGRLDVKLELPEVSFYFGVGGNLVYFDDAHRWALTGEVGVAFGAAPDVTLERNGTSGVAALDRAIDKAIKREQDEIDGYADWARWWPVVRLGVSYGF